jgi:hypothetical protein
LAYIFILTFPFDADFKLKLSGNFAMFTAMRRASSRVRGLEAERRSSCPSKYTVSECLPISIADDEAPSPPRRGRHFHVRNVIMSHFNNWFLSPMIPSRGVIGAHW